MKLTAYPKTIFCLALLLAWGNGAPPAMAQHGGWIEIQSWSAPQTVEVHTPRDSYNAVFHSEVQVFPNGAASGFLVLSAPDSRNGVVIYLGTGETNVANVKWDKNSKVARVLLRGRTVDGEHILVSITPDASEDCLIYTTIGTDVHATWEAQGQIVVNR